MSGLVGHLRRSGPGDAAAVRGGLEAAPHRGTAQTVVVRGSCALGVSSRVAYDASGIASDDEWVVAVAGVVDNLGELKAVLRDQGVSPSPETQAEICLAAHRLLGDAFPGRLRGAYAIAITDGRSLRAFRDHLGTGPLFYRETGEDVWIGSEAKQVAVGAGIPREPDLDVIEAIFYGHREDTMPTALRGIRRLPKSSLMHVTDQATHVRRYWDPTTLLEKHRFSAEELRERFDNSMGRAVDRVIRGDDILALSGGIDSPTLAIFASETYRRRFGRALPVLSMVFPDYASADESDYISQIVELLGLDAHSYQPPRAAQSLARLDEWTYLTDGPWMGWWEPGMDEDRYARLRSMGRLNYLTGDFAEFAMAMPFHLVPHLIWKGHLRAAARHVRSQRTQGIRRSRVARQLASAFLPGAFFRWYRGVRRLWPVPEWLDPARMMPTSPAERLPPWERWRHMQLGGFLGAGLPFEAYQIFNEAQGVSVRWPWADVDVWELFLGLPAATKYPDAQPKRLVRDLVKGRLPDSVVERRDRTVLDDFVQSSFDYSALSKWIDHGSFRIPGVNYDRLKARLERGNLRNFEYESIKDIAQVHAFLSNWESRAGAAPSPNRS